MLASRGIHDLVICPTSSTKGTMLATASADQMVRIWWAPCMSVVCLAELPGHADQVTQLAWSSISRCLASTSLDKTVRIWTCDNAAPCAWSCQAKLTGHSGRVTALRFVQEGTQIVTGSTDSTLRIWCCASWKCIKILQGHKSLVTVVDCSGDGQLVASASGDGCCCVWDLAEGALKHKLQADSGGVTSCRFIPDRQSTTTNVLATAHYDRQRNQVECFCGTLQ
ncbi:hypothetical protein WJX79_003411 [Trebouxia sp. C0005]